MKLPLPAVALVLFALSLAELVLLPQASPMLAVVGVHVVVLGTLLLMPRRPVLVLALILLELFAVKELQINQMVSVALSLLGPFAAFAAAALAPTRRLPLVALLLAAHIVWRATLPSGDTVTIIVTTALLASAAVAGALLHRGQRRLEAILAEREGLVEALAGGPGDASTAEQLRMWSEVEQRIEPVIAALPTLVEHAERSGDAADLEAVRAQAAEALAEMQATVRTLGSTEPLEPLAPEQTTLQRLADVLGEYGPVETRGRRGVRTFHAAAQAASDPRLRLLAGRVRALGGQLHVRGRRGATAVRVAFDSPERRRLRTISPLWLACALLLAGAVAELITFDPPGPWGLVLTLLPLLAPRAPVAAALAVAGAVWAASAADMIPAYATTPDFVASLTLLVIGAFATPRRAIAGLVIVEAGMLAALAADATAWPTVSYISLVLVLAGSWGGGVLLRGVASRQRRVGAGLADAVEALDELEARAIKRERVRLAHELHDLVGHALTAVAIQAGAAKAQLKRGRPPAYDLLTAAATQGADELRRLASVLGHDLGETTVAAELARVTATARAAGQDVELELEPVEDVDPRVRHTVVCVAAEALTNAAKHASGAPVRIRLDVERDTLALAVIDRGGGSEGLPSGGRGMTSMAQRVRACGGTFDSGPQPGGGWSVRAVLPLSV